METQMMLCAGRLPYVLLFANDKRQLWAWKDAIREQLAGLRLTLHERSSTVYPVTHGIPFLGFRLYPRQQRLKRRNGIAFCRRLRAWRAAVNRGEMTLAQLSGHIRGWIAHAAHGDAWGLRRALLKPVRVGGNSPENSTGSGSPGEGRP